eukprot:NODE_38_length_30618_cov_0.377142.p22 type:complete len:104 gc:universal NODE_38_length_30618_cov_0.377142:11713-12024(+)
MQVMRVLSLSPIRILPLSIRMRYLDSTAVAEPRRTQILSILRDWLFFPLVREMSTRVLNRPWTVSGLGADTRIWFWRDNWVSRLTALWLLVIYLEIPNVILST